MHTSEKPCSKARKIWDSLFRSYWHCLWHCRYKPSPKCCLRRKLPVAESLVLAIRSLNEDKCESFVGLPYSNDWLHYPNFANLLDQNR